MTAKKLYCLWAAVFSFWLISSGAYSQRISAAEYFWNNDPGPGNGTSISVTARSLQDGIDSALATLSQLPAPGTHSFNLRLRDANGIWGPVFSTMLQVVPSPSVSNRPAVTFGEIFIGNDPGQGNATPLVAFAGNLSQSVEAAFFNLSQSLQPGQFTVGVRFRDGTQNWSQTFQSIISVEAAPTSIRRPKVTQGEYYLTNDPGFGAGTPLIAINGNWDEALTSTANVLANSLTPGQYLLGIRLKDNANNWGPTSFSMIDIVAQPTGSKISLSRAEIFWGMDPGQGNGTALWTNGNMERLVAQAAQTLLPPSVGLGNINFGVRLKDSLQNWGPVFNTVLAIEATPTPNNQAGISAAEYFWNTDPGEGSATPLLASDGNYDRALESALDPALTINLPEGTHFLWVRFKDRKNLWGPKFGRAVEVSLLLNNSLATPLLLSPNNSATNVWINPTFRYRRVAGATSYVIQYSTSSTFNANLVTVSSTDTFKVEFGLQYANTYYWRVRASSPTGVGPWSTTFSFETRPLPIVLPSPVINSPVNNALQVPTGVRLDWLWVLGTHYEVQLDTSSGFNSPFRKGITKPFINASSNNSDTEWEVDDLYFGKKHFWRVRVMNATDTSLWSTSAFTTTDSVILEWPKRISTVMSPTLDWRSSNGIDFYQFEVDTTANFNSSVKVAGTKNYINSSSVNSDTEQLLALRFFNKTYYWRVRAINAVDTSLWNTSWFKTLDKITLNGPNNRETQAGVTFDWNSLAGVSAYHLEYDTSRNFNSPELQRVSNTYINASSTNSDTEKAIEDLFFNVRYFWRVRANTSIDTSLWSDVMSFTTTLPFLVNSPNDRSITDASVLLDWNSYRGSKFYDFQIDTTSDFNSPFLISGTNNFINTSSVNSDTEEPIGPLSYGANYYWRVRPRNDRSTGNYAPVRQFTVTNRVTLLSPNNGATQVGTSVTLDWANLAGTDNYTVEWSQDPRFILGVNSALKQAITTQHSVTGLNAGVWWWRVKATNSVSVSLWTEPRWFSTNTTIPALPGNVTLVSPFNGATNLPVNTLFVWGAASSADGHEIQLALDRNFVQVVYADTLAGTSTNLPLNFNTVYYWRVRGLNQSQFLAGDWSTERTLITRVDFRLEKPILNAPVNNAVNQARDLNFSWQSIGNATGYILIIDGSPNFDQNPLVFNTTGTDRDVANFNLSSTWYWKVLGVSGSDTSRASDVFSFTIRGPQRQLPPILQSPSNGALNVNASPVLSWNPASPDPLFFELEIAADSNFNQVIRTQRAALANLTLNNLPFDSTLYWRVRTFGAEDTSGFSSFFSFRTEQEPNQLGRSTNLLPIDNAINQPFNINFSWASVVNATGYEIQVDTLANFFTATSRTLGAINSFNLPAFAYSKKHFWRVRAFGNNNSFGPWSAFTSFTVKPETPATPRLLRPINDSLVDFPRVLLDWDSVNNGRAFVVQWTASDFNSIHIWEDTVSVSRYELLNLDSSSRYRWRVKALNQSESSNFSNEGVFRTKGSERLQSPVIIQLSNTTFPTFPVAVWTTVQGAISYEVRVFNNQFIRYINTTNNFLDLASIQPPVGVQLRFEVRAVSGNRTGDVVSRLFTINNPILNPPLVIAPINNIVMPGVTVLFNWYRAAFSQQYEYRISTSPSFTNPITGTVFDTSITINGFAQSTDYWWQVRSVFNGVASAWSSSNKFTTGTPGVAIGMPILLSPADGASISSGNPIELVWSAVPRAVTYQIKIDTFPDFRTSPLAFTGQVKADFSGLLIAGKTYYWAVRAIRGSDSSAYTATRSFVLQTPVISLSSPRLLLPFNGAANQNNLLIHLVWSSVNSTQTYEVQVDTSIQFRNPVRAFLTSDTSGPISFLKIGTRYYWRVRASNSSLVSAWSGTRSFVTSNLPARIRPIFPTQLSPAFAAVAVNPIGSKLLWRQIRNGVGYRVQLDGPNGLTSNIIVDTSFSLPNLNLGTTYRWRVKSFIPTDSSDWSGWFNFKTIEPSTLSPQLVSPANNANVPANAVVFIWRKMIFAGQYRLEADTNSNFANAISIVTSDTSYAPALLTARRQWYWRVKAYIQNDSSDWSNFRFLNTLPVTFSVPTLVSPILGTVVPYNSPIIFKWIGNDIRVSRYEVLLSRDSLGVSQIVGTFNSLADSLVYNGNLDVGIRYYWRVRALDLNGQSAWTQSRSFRLSIPEAVLKSPGNFSVVAAVNIELVWFKTPKATDYRLEVATDRDFVFTLLDLNTIDTSETIPSLVPGLRYWWRITPRFANSIVGNATGSRIFDIDPLSVSSSVNKQEPQLYPNPASASFKITYAGELTSGYLLNAHGIKVLSFEITGNEPTVHLGDLPSGVYQVVLHNRFNETFRRRITVIRSSH